jgi:hypothetical protein
MPKTRLDLDALDVETFATVPPTATAAEDPAKRSAATSCVNRPPYCTC